VVTTHGRPIEEMESSPGLRPGYLKEDWSEVTMKRRNAFRPALWDALEDRTALSGASAAAGHEAAAPARRSQAADVVSTSTSPTYEELTTTYANGDAGDIVGVGKITGTTQTEYRLTVPAGNNATTTTESINLAGGAGLEKVVNVSTRQGNTTTENITTTLPDGTIATKTETEVKHGHETVITAALNTPGVGNQTTKGTIVHSGPKTITNETITTAAGTVYHYRRVAVHSGPLDSTAASTTTGPGGAITNQVKSSTTVTPLAVPTS
jgi:hypothetical protein